MTVLKLGIDNGNYNTKSSERMLYASGFTRSDREFITNDMQLFYDGVYYAVGGKRMSFQQDKTKEDDTFILSLPTVADAMKRVGVLSAEVLLGVGLPVDIYGTQKDTFRKYFLRETQTLSLRESHTAALSRTARCSPRAMLRCVNITHSLRDSTTSRSWISVGIQSISSHSTISR